MATLADPVSFIRAQTRPLPVPDIPGIVLQLADDVTQLWQATEREMDAVGLPPPFWAFAWPGGQALARHIGEHPALIRGRSVLDLGSGSGLVAIVAAQQGGNPVVANDVDPIAAVAIAMNARRNDVSLTIDSADLVGLDHGWDVVLAGDIAYEAEMARRLLGWLEQLADRGADVLIGDPGRAYLAHENLDCVARYDVRVSRAIEDGDVKISCVWRFKGR